MNHIFEYSTITMADYPSILALWESTPGVGLSSADSPTAMEAFLVRNPGTSFLCRTQAGTLAGTILAGHDGRRGYLYHLAVAPEFRMQGIATALVEQAEASLKAQGISKVHLFVFADNDSGRAFWSKRYKPRPDIAVHSRDL